MKRRTFLAATAAAMVPAAVWAHGPTRQKVTLTTEVAAPPDEVWAAIGNFDDMSWHPAVFSTEGNGGNTIDATRLLTLGQEGGPTIAEVLYKFSDEKMSYSYRITDVAVEVIGDMAMFTGRVAMHVVAGGRDVNIDGRYSAIWVKRDGRWQFVCWQSTPMPAG